ncbi:glycosyltransferase family 2 protein [Lewinella sp. 4G2]|uniref:glycosyltransferase family 2 protein n=1 Tax=Lewinella sp. 4G2 TaxID=1803372 RepID=UPI0007B4F500|nr:glycosyltransferase [Lewinella sp. 4G2]OAV42756.1 hypothetical protein A3850_016080 [Lewinella sp. 4G2]
MVSICIPTYQYDVTKLVLRLQEQMDEVDFPTELLVYDDASPQVPGWWASKQKLERRGTVLKRLEHNLGRGKIRNQLVRDARFPFVLLLDADAAVPNDFLATYGRHLNLHQPILPLLLIGGRTYAEDPPTDRSLHLHWWYGRKRESTDRPYRENPFHGFQSNNFVASRQLLLDRPFPEDAIGYGHEDTLWGQQLEGKGITLKRIDNPVVHLGLEPAPTFLRKQREAILNLARLRSQHPHLRTRLTDLYEKAPLMGKLVKLLPEKILIQYLMEVKKPDLRGLDALKLRWYAEEMGKRN